MLGMFGFREGGEYIEENRSVLAQRYSGNLELRSRDYFVRVHDRGFE